MPANETLSEFLSEHYAYELLMLRYSYARLSQTHGQLEWNAVFESCAVHARNLRDFYTNDSDSRNYTARDYGVSGLAARKEHSGAFEAINRQIDHLGKKRPTRPEDGKLTTSRIMEVVEWLEEKHSEFIDRCEPATKQGWSEDRAIPPTTTLVVLSLTPNATNHVVAISTGYLSGATA
ncbi:MAG: hypothetical protein ACTHOR_09155 [Devosia sp.]